ncbi:MAG: hypothetical protein E6J14_10595 [Chloroflexi bacterium]|nr:MAG: hypothetical protein E6J14_10595 [Chloroflexota bacterium]
MVRFADVNDGWVFDPELWATHDGGAHWQRPTLPGAASPPFVVALEAAAGVVHAVLFDASAKVRIESSPVGADSWDLSPVTIPVGAGPVPSAQLVLQGSTGWLTEVDRTVIGGARLAHGHWLTWQPPCASAGGSAVLAASTPTSLVAVCHEGTWTSGPETVHAYFSSNGGASFRRAARELPQAFGGVVGSPRPGAVIAGGYADDGTDGLLATYDGGTSWTTVYRGAPANGTTEAELGFTSAAQGVVIETHTGVGTLLMTFDGGHQWQPVRFQPT